MSKRASEMSQNEQMNLQNEIYLIVNILHFLQPFVPPSWEQQPTKTPFQVTQRMSRCFVGSSSAVSACFPSWAQRRIRLLAARRVWCGLKRGAARFMAGQPNPAQVWEKYVREGWLIGQPLFLAIESRVWPF